MGKKTLAKKKHIHMPLSPQADNWLRNTSAVFSSFSVAFVPPSLLKGYRAFFDHRLSKRNYRVVTETIPNLKDILHPDAWRELEIDQDEIIKKYPHLNGIFDGPYRIMYSKNDWRPIPRDFEEKDFLEEMKWVARQKPRHSNDYADAVRYTIENGVQTSFPILVLQVKVKEEPVQMRPLFRR